jgi:rod shape-determining protein MreB
MADDIRTRALQRMTEAFALDSGLRAATEKALQRMSEDEVEAELITLEELKMEAYRLYELAESRERNKERAPAKAPSWRRWAPAIADAVSVLNPARLLHAADFCFDIGTANTRIYAKNEGVLVDEPSLVAVEGSGVDARIVAVGSKARSMADDPASNVRLIRPVQDGFVSDAILAEGMMRSFVEKAKLPLSRRPRVAFSVPSGATADYRQAMQRAAGDLGIAHAYLIYEPVAAALGAGVLDQGGTMVVDIGGGTTDMAVLSHDKRIEPHVVRLGGDQMTDAIASTIRRNYRLLVGEEEAEKLKIKLGSALPPQSGDGALMTVSGRNVWSRDRVDVVINQREVAEMLRGPVEQLAKEIKTTLTGAAPEVRGEIERNGVVLTGGGANLQGIGAAISKEIGVAVRVHDDPQLCVARGMGIALADWDAYQQLWTGV